MMRWRLAFAYISGDLPEASRFGQAQLQNNRHSGQQRPEDERKGDVLN